MNVLDMHCDTISHIYKNSSTSLRSNSLQIDLLKLRKANYLLQNFAMFVDQRETNDPLKTALEMIDCYYLELDKNKDMILPVFSYQDILNNQQAGKMSAMLTLEEGAVLQGSLSHLRTFYRLGVRMIALTWNFENEIGSPNLQYASDGVPLLHQRNSKGLTPRGIEIIREMEKLGMIIDVSHLSDGGFQDILRYTSCPFVASHSNAAALSGVSRNLTDSMIRSLADRGGVTGLNFCTDFLIEPAVDFAPNSSMQANTADAVRTSKINDMVNQIRYISNVGGIDVCALGSDFDGIDNAVEFGDAGGIGQLAEALHREGFSWSDIEKIFYKNALRLYKDILS